MKPKSSSGKSQALGLCFLSAMATTGQAQIQTAGDLLVDLNFTTLTPGDLPYVANGGTLGGGFEAFGAVTTIPVVKTAPLSTVKALYLDGGDFMMSVDGQTPLGGTPSRKNAPAGLMGPQPSRSVEVWVYNESMLDEETVLAWGKRGGGEGQNYSCLYGTNATWGALGQWGGPDLGWAGAVTPAGGTWHHLTYVHTGTDTEGGGADPNDTLVYVDGVLNNSENAGVLNTHPGPILLGAQMNGDGVTPDTANRGSLYVAKVRIHDGALTAAQVANNYSFETAGFPATLATPLAPRTGPVHRWSFAESSGTKVTDSSGYYHGIVRGAGSSWTGNSLALPGGGSGSQAYVDLPNRLISSHAPELGGSGEVTLEMWVTVTGTQNWARIFDFGSTNGTEIPGPGGGGEGWDYLFLSASEGTNTGRTIFSLRHRDPLGNGPLGAGGPGDVNPNYGYNTSTFGNQRHLTVVWRDKQYLHVYEDEQPMRELRPGDIRMVQLNDVNCWLGRSNWLGDANLAGDLNEFRIYDRALTAGEVLQNRADGPDAALPGAPDDDGDGLPNWFERLYASPTLNSSVAGSPSQALQNGDSDSLTNLQEFQNGTNPLLSDTDGDGLDDGQEVARGTNPLLGDTDGDGLSDGAEVNTYLSNPLLTDTDSDGYTDAQEVAGGSNPNDANSIPVVFLVSRYSFNNPDGPAFANAPVVDSVSGLNGYVRGNNATWTAGGLALPGGSSADAPYVDLPNNLLSRFAKANGGRGAVSMEGWITLPTIGGGWQRILDFGSSAPGMNLGEIFRPGRTTNNFADGLDYFFLSGARGTNTAQRRVDWTNNDRFGGLGGGSGADFDASANTLDAPFHFAVTVDENTGKIFYYENGVQVATFDTTLKLDALNDVNCWLGRSNWTNDANLQGTFDEFRIYAGSLSAADVVKTYNKGPGTLPNGSNPATDITTLKITNAAGWPAWWADRNPSLPAPGSDTDGDGLTALQELGRGSDPAKRDTDNDGLPDGAETNTGFFVNAGNTGTNPAVADTDHDGLSDGQEIAAGTDPFDPDTDHDLAFDGQDANPTSNIATVLAPAHRWPFNDLPATIAADTISADVAGGPAFAAIIRGTGATSDGTGVSLPGGNNVDTTPYVDLPNALISPQKAVTLVGWVTVNNTAGNWARFFDFGNSNNQEVPPAGIGNGTDYFAYTMQRGGDGNTQRFTIREEPFGESVFDPNTATTVGQEIFYAATVDASAGNCSVFNLYRDGEWILQSSGCRYPLSTITDVNNWLGRSQYAGDTNLNGVYNEFRIYNGVLNAKAVKILYNSGADNTFRITDSVDTGLELQLIWNSRPNLSYTIESSPDLVTWSPAVANIPSAGFTTTAAVPKGSGRLYFRVRLDD